MKTAFIHIGLHKTGTTSIQEALHRRRGAVSDAGLHYPSVGMPPDFAGHHNLAWELARDRRHVPEHGNVPLLLAGLAGVETDVIVSSEDFESVVARPDRWVSLVEGLGRLGFAVEFIVYLRDPVRHLRSLYAELLRDGFGDEFHKVALTALDTGRIERRDQVFMLDQNRVVAGLKAIAGTIAQVRDFENLVGGDVVSDFAVATRMTPAVRQALGTEGRRSNVSIPVSSQLLYFLIGKESGLRVDADLAQRMVEMLIAGDDVVLDMPEQLKLALRRRHLLPQLSTQDHPRATDADVLNIVRVFSFESRIAFRRMLLIDGSSGTLDEKQAAWAKTRAAWLRFARVMD